MKKRIKKFLLVLISIVLLIDLITMRGINLFLDNPSRLATIAISSVHWGISAFFIILLFVGIIFTPDMKSASFSRKAFIITGIFILFYIPKLVFVSLNVLDELIFQTARFMQYEGEYMLILSKVGIVLAGFTFLLIFFGIIRGKTNLKITHESIHSPSVPDSFDGFKIIHISDFHLGSIPSRSGYPQKIAGKINQQKADLILFTGDLINNVASEAEPWIDVLKSIKGKTGKYAITGNHDYGEYVNWKDDDERNADQQKLKAIFEKTGFYLLENQGTKIKKNDESLGIIGVENWGQPPFQQYGNFKKALDSTPITSYQILMSHDPSHWDAEVLNKTNIGLTLSGHTHGFQFGIMLNGKFQWSPVQYKYPRWAGLYKEGNQYLNINRGLGYIGFPGRIGMPPEISVLTLKKSKQN
ncbi:MAG: metallophosphoesterase [Bacteroidales bacterium]|nr:metallophosphoesterase [Bacteroidales bacterium]